jgi:hypothetical protein
VEKETCGPLLVLRGLPGSNVSTPRGIRTHRDCTLLLFYLILSYFILFYFILFYFILFYFILFYFIFVDIYCSGGLHPIECYAVLPGGVSSLAPSPSVYHYALRHHGLEQRGSLGHDVWEKLAIKEGCFIIGLSSIHW